MFPQKLKNLILWMFLVIILTSACELMTILPDQETQTADGVIYFDDFSDPNSDRLLEKRNRSF